MKADARLSWNLFIDCPHCGETMDLADSDYDCEGYISRPIFNNEWDKLSGHIVACGHCEKEFEIDAVEY